MKYSLIVIMAMVLLTSCATHDHAKPKPIIGVWEMTGVYLPHDARPINVGSGLTNKKNIYTADGIYHDTAADSDKMTDTSIRRYTTTDGTVTIISASGNGTTYSYTIVDDTMLIVVMRSGTQAHFKRLSHTTSPIPVVPEIGVQVKRLPKPE